LQKKNKEIVSLSIIGMTLFVHRDNQELLWKVTNQLPQLVTYFTTSTVQSKEEWFKSIIKTYYEKYKHKTLTIQELQQINQEVVTHMIQTTIPPTAVSPTQVYPSPLSTRPLPQQYPENKTQYRPLYDNPPPPEPVFQDKVEDTAIPNMDELVRNHIQQREAELRKYSPPSPVQSQPNITIEPDNIMETPKRSVTWAETLEQQEPNYKAEVQVELNSLRTMVMSLLTKVSDLEDKMSTMRQSDTSDQHINQEI